MNNCFEGNGKYCKHYIMGDCILPPDCRKYPWYEIKNKFGGDCENVEADK